MILEIIKILPIKKSQTEGAYIRIEFKDEQGKWYKTDVVPGYRNYERWAKVLKIGNKVFNTKLKDSQTVDADSNVLLLQGRKNKEKARQEKIYEEIERLRKENPRELFYKYGIY